MLETEVAGLSGMKNGRTVLESYQSLFCFLFLLPCQPGFLFRLGLSVKSGLHHFMSSSQLIHLGEGTLNPLRYAFRARKERPRLPDLPSFHGRTFSSRPAPRIESTFIYQDKDLHLWMYLPSEQLKHQHCNRRWPSGRPHGALIQIENSWQHGVFGATSRLGLARVRCQS